MLHDLFGSLTTGGMFVAGYVLGILVAWAAFRLVQDK